MVKEEHRVRIYTTFDNRIGKKQKEIQLSQCGNEHKKSERETVIKRRRSEEEVKEMKRTAVPAGAGDERSAERFREEKSPTTLLLAGRRKRHLSLFFFVCVPLHLQRARERKEKLIRAFFCD